MIKFENICKEYTGVEVLHNVSFELEPGTINALVGENGAGKSTLMKILSGVITDYSGTVRLNGNERRFRRPSEAEAAGISIIHQELNLIPTLSAAENIFLGREPLNILGLVDFKTMNIKAAGILEGFGFPFPSDIKVSALSVGWQQIVEIARVFSIETDVIILDEPTSALTDSEIKILFEKIRFLKDEGKTIIFITHRMDEIFELSDNIIVMRDGSYVCSEKTAETNKDFIIEKMTGRKLTAVGRRSELPDEKILEVSDLTFMLTELFGISGVNFNLAKGEILGVAGLMGSGKSYLLQFLFGLIKNDFNGTITYKGEGYDPSSPSKVIRSGIYYLTKNRKEEGILPGLDIITNTSISRLKEFSAGVINRKKESEAVNRTLDKLNVKRHSGSNDILTLSGGNQQKTLLARGIINEPELLLLDEPTRGIDVGAKEEIYNIMDELSSAGMSIIISSSEIPELLRVTDNILVMSQGVQRAYLKTIETDSGEILKHSFEQG